MKNIHQLSLILYPLFLILLLASCQKKQAQDTFEIEDEPVVRTVEAMEDYVCTDTVTFDGHRYVYTLQRHASDSLPMVKDELENSYKDNTVSIDLRRDGHAFFHHTFTKTSFAEHLSAADFEQSTLNGICFQEGRQGEGLVFLFLLGNPSSDQNIPFTVTIAPTATYAVRPVDNLEQRAE